jgi:hypothetical protein
MPAPSERLASFFIEAQSHSVGESSAKNLLEEPLACGNWLQTPSSHCSKIAPLARPFVLAGPFGSGISSAGLSAWLHGFLENEWSLPFKKTPKRSMTLNNRGVKGRIIED